jgi:hypothetical protein
MFGVRFGSSANCSGWSCRNGKTVPRQPDSYSLLKVATQPSWLLRVAAANQVSLAELLQGFEFQYGRVLTNEPIDFGLPENAITALSCFCRIAPKTIRMLDLQRRVPHLTPALLLRFQHPDPFCSRSACVVFDTPFARCVLLARKSFMSAGIGQ